jgi:hypothetical protein
LVLDDDTLVQGPGTLGGADFDVDGIAANANLASHYKVKSPGVREWRLATPLTELSGGKLTVSVRDRQGNLSRIERTFAMGQHSAKR